MRVTMLKEFSACAVSICAVVTLAVAIGLVHADPPPQSDLPQTRLSAREILDHTDDLFRGTSSTGRATMAIVTEHWARTLTLDFQTKGKDRSLIRILAPKKEKGTATLRVGNDLWNYLPKVNRVIKLPSSMMSASWMGSHITNDDLVRESRMADDYSFEISFEGLRDNEAIVEITCIPTEDAAVVWGKVVVVVEARHHLPRRVLYYDEDLELVRTMSYRDVRELDGRRLPTVITVVPIEKPLESTSVRYEALDFDSIHDEERFSLRALQQ
jgi:hypothetical protein